MGVRLRLDSISASLADSFRKADDEQRRHAALATCLVAVARSGLQGNEIDAAVDLLRHGGEDQLAVRRKLDSLTEQFDEQYFKLSEMLRAQRKRLCSCSGKPGRGSIGIRPIS